MLHKLSKLTAVSLLLLGGLTTAAHSDAASFLPLAKICVASGGQSYVDRHKLMNWAVSNSWNDHVIPHDLWDLNDDGDLVYAEKLAVLTNLSAQEICKSGKCREGDIQAIEAMQRSFNEGLDSGVQKKFTVLASNGAPDTQWNDRDYISKRRLIFDYKNAKLRIACLAEYKAEEPLYELPADDEDEDPSGVRVSLGREDLGTPREKLRTVVPAKFSVTQDIQNDGWSWAVEGYAGYRFDWETQKSSGSVIPFVHVVQKTSNDNDDDIDKLGVGLDTFFYRAAVGDFQAGVEYLTDSKAELDILTGQLTWFYYVPGLHLGLYEDLGDSGVQVKITPRLTLHGGRVFDRGSHEEIASNADYLRGGPGLRVQFRGEENTSMEDFEFSTDAKYLFGIAGDNNDYYRLESALNYFFPGQDNFSLGLTYTYGYQDDTLEKENLVEAVLGARF